MKKFLLLMMSFFGLVLAALAQSTATFDFTNPTGLNPSITPSEEASKGVSVSGTEFTDNGVTLVATKGSNDAFVWTNSAKNNYVKELRAYKSATITVTAPNGQNISNIAFTGSDVKAASMTVTEGAYDGASWTGSANSVVFTLTATIKVNTITVTYGEGGGTVEPVDPVDPVDPVEKTTLFEETFLSSFGQFTTETVTAPEGDITVWQQDSKYGAKASAYMNNTSYACEAWLVSSELDMTKATKLSLSFEHAINKTNVDEIANQYKLYVKPEGGEWTAVGIATYPAGNTWAYTSNTQDISAYDGKKFQIAFAYKATAESAGTWEIKNLKIEGVGESVIPEPEVPNYATLADMQAAATTTKAAATLTADNLLVTGVGKRGTNYTTYVTDGTTSAILYGPNEPIAKKGDKLAGKLAGNVVVYNSSLELDAVDFTDATVASSDNEVKPQVVTIADLGNDANATYQSRYVRLENVNFDAEALASSNINIVDDSDNSIVLRDQYGVLADFIFNTTKAYNVNAYVAYYNNAAQLYVCSDNDIEIITNLKDAETAWSKEVIAVEPNKELETIELTTLSDGQKTFTSSNEKVATIDAEGNITKVGFGHTVITVETAETDNYLASKASFDLYYIEGEGTLENPYAASDLEYYNGIVTDKVWVKGTIIGYISDTKTGDYSPIDDKVVNTNLALGSEDAYVPVQLPKGGVRDALNLVDNAEMQGKTVCLYGNIATYCGKPGLKNVSDYSFDGLTGIGSATIAADNAATVIYSIDGRRLSQPVKGLNIINGKKVMVK